MRVHTLSCPSRHFHTRGRHGCVHVRFVITPDSLGVGYVVDEHRECCLNEARACICASQLTRRREDKQRQEWRGRSSASIPRKKTSRGKENFGTIKYHPVSNDSSRLDQVLSIQRVQREIHSYAHSISITMAVQLE